jgi:predicted phosphoadenosine phosphosulfate sulfurtransferase
LDTASLVLVVGRRGRPFRARERQQLNALARIANHRWVELVTRVSRMIHPSATS